MVVKSTTAHIFHVGDCRIYRVAGKALEQLTEDHRIIVSSEQTYLGRALGINPQIEIDYQALEIGQGDIFLLATDGAYEFADHRFITSALDAHAGDLDEAAKSIVEEAYRRGSDDNITVQILRIDEAPQTGHPTYSAARPSCRCHRCRSRGRCSTATASCGKCMPPAAATSILRSTPRPKRWSP